MAGRLQGRAAIVTGAGAGIGAAIATAFASEGAQVLIADIDEAAAAASAARIGDGAVFLLGSDDANFTAQDDGTLRLGIDDGDSQRNYGDNAGSITVIITILPPEIPVGPDHPQTLPADK